MDYSVYDYIETKDDASYVVKLLSTVDDNDEKLISDKNDLIKNVFVLFSTPDVNFEIIEEPNIERKLIDRGVDFGLSNTTGERFCKGMSTSFLDASVYENDYYALIRFSGNHVHSAITFNINREGNLYIDAYCANNIMKFKGAVILLNRLIDFCVMSGIKKYCWIL
jgi:hypothetical protein